VLAVQTLSGGRSITRGRARLADIWVRRWIRLVVVGLNVSFAHTELETGDNRLDLEGWIVGKGIGEDVPRGDFHRLFEQIVFKDNETMIEGRRRRQNGLPVLKNLLNGSRSVVNVKV